LNQNPNRGSYCSRECQGNPRIEINKGYFKKIKDKIKEIKK